MQYRLDKHGNKISALGFGCMRFSQKAGRIDYDKAESEIMQAFSNGVNYYDTAYIYLGSEVIVGKVLEKNNIRDKVYIATKLPHYMVKSHLDFDKFFNEQLKRLQTDYIDYYLIHMLTDVRSWQRLIDFGVLDWIKQKKSSGQIRQIGFSYHGNSDMFCDLIDAYDWDFTQIQYNYLDVNSQAGEVGLKYAANKNIPVIIMEPLRGGKLANDLPKKAVETINAFSPKRSPAQWGLRWLYNQPEVTCVLSGMNSIQMVDENIQIASETNIGSITDEEFEIYEKIVSYINEKTKVGCTGCRYCMPCPKNVDIPGSFAAYNRRYSDGYITGLKEYYMCTTLRRDYTGVSNCIECGKCEQHCPQNIAIRKELKNVARSLETPIYKIAKKVAPLFMKY